MQRHNDLNCFIYAEAEIGLCKLKKLKKWVLHRKWKVTKWRSNSIPAAQYQTVKTNYTVHCTQHCCLLSPVPPRWSALVSQQQHRHWLSRVVLNVLHKTFNEWVVWTALHCRPQVGSERSFHSNAPSPALLAVGVVMGVWYLNSHTGSLNIRYLDIQSLTESQSSWMSRKKLLVDQTKIFPHS